MPDVHKTTLLFVDDEEEILQICQTFCSDLVDQVLVTTDPEKALEYVSEYSIHVAVLDIKMPKMSGIQLLEKLKKVQPDLQCIMLTGYGDKQTAKEALNLQATGFIDKPFQPEELRTAITGALRKAIQTRVKNTAHEITKMQSQKKK